MGVARESVYITNVMKCRVSDQIGRNRTPKREETFECAKFLKAEIDWIQPQVILALGKVSLQYFFPEMDSMAKARGRAYDYHGIKVVPTWHPSYVLRQKGDDLAKAKREVWHDYHLAFQLLKQRTGEN
jgi:DNA polymerase